MFVALLESNLGTTAALAFLSVSLGSAVLKATLLRSLAFISWLFLLRDAGLVMCFDELGVGLKIRLTPVDSSKIFLSLPLGRVFNFD